MDLTIHLSDEQAAALQAQAKSALDYAERLDCGVATAFAQPQARRTLSYPLQFSSQYCNTMIAHSGLA